MKGVCEEPHFEPEGQIVLFLYPEAALRKDDIGDVRVLFIGHNGKKRCRTRVRRLVEHPRQKDSCTGSDFHHERW